ncbi:hypothetical protein QBC37DRAFT_15454 [Rhypophila decipiens]|uniref:C2H2-type domain-containing protein n=1 Tax=Rhypophila decipiens TaxID=261697 RepID=A0AAN6Y276_9PEZI|nr:hypothetical protein QBC37DRAFT_15454 [Rhypophila decipiens]
MQRNDTAIASHGDGYSLPDIRRHLRAIFYWLRNDEDAQRFYELNQAPWSNNVCRPLSRLSALSASSNNTVPSMAMSNHSLSDDLTWRGEAHPPMTAFPTYNDIAFPQAPQEPARYLGQQWDTLLFIDKGRRMRTPTSRGSSSRGRTPLPLPLQCPLCAVVGLVVSCQRQSEFKRHLKNKHSHNKVYLCPHQGCSLAFDGEWAFNEHCRRAQRHTVNSLQVTPTKLQAQKVFACGFSICRDILEAENDEDAEEKLNGYISHISDHLKKNPKPQWNYAVYFKNLMYQKGLKDLWKSRKRANTGIKWQPQPHNSYVLMKIIETRRYYDAALLVQCVEAVGSPPYNKPDSPAFPLPHNLSHPLEIGAGGDSVHNVAELQTNDPAGLSKDASVSQTTPPIAQEEYPIHFPSMNDSHVQISQETEKVLPRSYDLTQPCTHAVSYLNSDHQSQVGYDVHQMSSPFFPGSLPATHQASQYSSAPQNWNSAGYFPPEYQDHLIDPELLAANDFPRTDHSMYLETAEDGTDLAQDYA